jgi:hypothetical protein
LFYNGNVIDKRFSIGMYKFGKVKAFIDYRVIHQFFEHGGSFVGELHAKLLILTGIIDPEPEQFQELPA